MALMSKPNVRILALTRCRHLSSSPDPTFSGQNIFSDIEKNLKPSQPPSHVVSDFPLPRQSTDNGGKNVNISETQMHLSQFSHQNSFRSPNSGPISMQDIMSRRVNNQNTQNTNSRMNFDAMSESLKNFQPNPQSSMKGFNLFANRRIPGSPFAGNLEKSKLPDAVFGKELREKCGGIEEGSETVVQNMSNFGNFNSLLTPNFMLKPPQEELLDNYFHSDHMFSAEKMKLELKKVRDEYKMSESDCGSTRVQKMADQNVQRRDRRSPRIWSTQANCVFFQIAAEAYQAAGQSKKGIHKKIMMELNEALVNVPGEPPFTVKQVTAKYNALKKKWTIWRNLRNKTGAGWDNARGTISGSELWWIDRQAEFGNSVLKYKRQPIDNLNELEQIFGNSVATGADAYALGTTLNPQQSPSSPPAEDITHKFFDQQWEVPLEDINTQISCRQPTQAPGSSKGRSSRRSRYRQKIKKNRSESDSPASNPSTNASSSPSANASPQPTPPFSDLRTIVERVKKFEDIDLSKAISLLQIKNNRDTFTYLEDDDARGWLRFEIEKTNHKMRYQQYMMSMPPPVFTFLSNYPPTFPRTYPPQFPPIFPPQYPPQ